MSAWGLLVVMLVAIGCTTTTGISGPVTVILADPVLWCARLAPRLVSVLDGPVGGCVARRSGMTVVVCPPRDVQCLAHEIHHIVDPGWHHPPEER